ncbi:MAG TPA: hypothetical protein VHE30_21220 [Polyangiaceae bacterium]|nr:hypothetical protein [Polyangiaceae bacterium]
MKTTTWFKFAASGPYAFGACVLKNSKGVKQLDRKAYRKWLATTPGIDGRGVYIFATGQKKPKPWYVGFTRDNDFRGECGGKEWLINKMIQQAPGAPVLFLLSAPRGSSAGLASAIDTLETELIRAAHRTNRDLLNTNKKVPTWDTYVPGVLRSGAGNRSPAARALAKSLRLR